MIKPEVYALSKQCSLNTQYIPYTMYIIHCIVYNTIQSSLELIYNYNNY